MSINFIYLCCAYWNYRLHPSTLEWRTSVWKHFPLAAHPCILRVWDHDTLRYTPLTHQKQISQLMQFNISRLRNSHENKTVKFGEFQQNILHNNCLHSLNDIEWAVGTFISKLKYVTLKKYSGKTHVGMVSNDFNISTCVFL